MHNEIVVTFTAGGAVTQPEIFLQERVLCFWHQGARDLHSQTANVQ